jgi:hypothetical protein
MSGDPSALKRAREQATGCRACHADSRHAALAALTSDLSLVHEI